MTSIAERAAAGLDGLYYSLHSNPDDLEAEKTRLAQAAILHGLNPDTLTAGDTHFICMSVRSDMPSSGYYGTGITPDEVRSVCAALIKLAQGERQPSEERGS